MTAPPPPPASQLLASRISDHFWVAASPQQVRIAFAETTWPGTEVYHTAVILSAENARSLANLIEQQLLDAETMAMVARQQAGSTG